MRQNPKHISEASADIPQGRVLAFRKPEPKCDAPLDPQRTLDQVRDQAVAAGFGLALRDAEATLYVGRLFVEGRANEHAVRRGIEQVRKHLAQMEQALPQ